MEEATDLHTYLEILRRRKWQLIWPILVLAPLAVVLAMVLPPVYRSQATILIEQQEIPTELIQTTVPGFADQRIQVIEQRVMTLENLSALIEQYDLYPEIRRKQTINAAVEAMRDDVGLEMISAEIIDPRSGRPQQATIAFELSFESHSPSTAQKVTNELVSLFLAENLRQREESVREASQFLREEAEKLAVQIRGLEAALAKFKQEHRNNLPELFTLNRELMQRAEEQLLANARDIRALEEQRLLLETQLNQLEPSAFGNGKLDALTPAARLSQLEAEYAGIAARYSASHPDRVNMEREIRALRKVVGSSDLSALWNRRNQIARELEIARERYAPEHPDVQRLERDLAQADERLATARADGSVESSMQGATNPAYVQLQTRLDAVNLEIEGLRESNEELRARIETYEQRLLDAPNVEREYRDLTRGYDNAVAKYREIKDKQLEAELAEALETGRKAERFTLIEPPGLPEKPIQPHRLAISLLGLVLSVSAGVGNVALRESLDKGIYGARAVQMLAGASPMAVIPYISVPAERRKRTWRRYLLMLAAMIGLALVAVAVHLFVMPLDVIWFTLLSKFES
ncbi:GumC family protein [Halochromatium glycolicum]|uniref:Lipopolysaccharide biosynthesis protein n=1 Tax=Halochromatium glycolicum TaxID=85075 RepID=A0AAJ0U8E4_9GAMM|nr:Wzz/FepE/Etk N-terminal domain-containing protein [Halochromatium glycolicum]MBK1706362.1 lipopolysaccharide biosynthesis protein [Halochromatium glycolicum]